jgi:hypothetical protein
MSDQAKPETTEDGQGQGQEGEEKVSTLFCSGLPLDIRHREVHNFFRFCEGFEHVALNLRGKVPVAFIKFDKQESALEAKAKFHGMRLDPELHFEIRLELARADSKGRKRRLDEGGDSEKRGRFIPPIFAVRRMPPSQFPGGIPRGDRRDRDGGARAPCTTLFVANLPPDYQEEDVQTLFANQHGLRKIRVGDPKGSSCVAFVDFADIAGATEALRQMQGQQIDGRPLRIEFARQAMGAPARTTPGSGPIAYEMNPNNGAAAAGGAPPYGRAPIASSNAYDPYGGGYAAPYGSTPW